MLPILTPEESAELDRRSAERGVTVGGLMERAGEAVARKVRALTGGSYGRRALVICGKGNNGGDGLVAARSLRQSGVGVTVLLLSEPGSLKGATAANFRRFAAGGRWKPLSEAAMHHELARADVVVDAVFGTGFRGSPEGDVAACIRAVNASGIDVVAVDIPSGVDGATGAVAGSAVRARATVTFGAMKPGLVFFPGAGFAGEVEVADIGFPPDLVVSDLSLQERADVSGLLSSREPESHKRSAGYVVVVAGSNAMTGAAILVGTAAYRAGAGLVTLAVPSSVIPVVEAGLTEATFLPLPETSQGTVSEEGWSILGERLAGAGAAAIGPGLTTNPSTMALVRHVVADSPVPFVLDADGLNAFEGHASMIAERRSAAVLTPHAGELSRLTGISSSDVTQDRIGQARKAASEFRCPVLLKGSRTVIARPDGRAVVNPTGGPFLATAGTGDVLAGMIAAFLARGLEAADAAALGAYVHGVAGRLAAEELNEGTMASDVAANLPKAIAAIREGVT